MKHTKTKTDLILDFDETLFNTSRQTRIFLNHYFGIQIPIDDTQYMCGHSLHEFVLHYLPSGHTLSEGDLYEILGREFLASRLWHEDIFPIPGVLDIVPQLAERYTLHIATARQISSKPVVEMLLGRFLPGLISSTHFVWEHLGDQQFRSIPKKEFVQTLFCPVAYIDDNPKETREIMGLVPHVILFDPYDYHVETPDASHRISHWGEVQNLLL